MKIRYAVGLVALLVSSSTLSQSFSVTELPKAHCDSEDWNHQILRAGGKASDPKCALMFLPEEPPSGREHEAEAIISLNGKITKVWRSYHRVTPRSNKEIPTLGQQHSYLFVSRDKTLKVTINSRVVDSSCHVDTESCCGDNYKGDMAIEQNGQRVVFPIEYYRGG